MGKRILVQRMGRGSPTFRNRGHLRVAPAKYPPIDPNISLKGRVVELVHDPGRWVPLAKIVLENNVEFYVPAVEGMYVNQIIEYGLQASINNGNILPLQAIPEGTQICNVEKRPGDGGKFIRAPGTYGILLSKSIDKATVQLPSGKVIELPIQARAMIGVVAGAGRIEKPLLKAGASYHKWRVKARKWPRVRGVAMNPCSHPHGGGRHVRRPTTVSRNAPPGRKVGHIAARRTGRRT